MPVHTGSLPNPNFVELEGVTVTYGREEKHFMRWR